MFYRLLKLDPRSREGVIAATSALGILVNLVIASTKVVIGVLTASIAILSEGVNNASDALTALITLIGAKLAGMHPDQKHPFGYGRVEYLTSLIIAVLILVTGTEMLTGSVRLLFAPEEMTLSLTALLIVAGSAVVKLALGLYTMKKGKEVDSDALIAVGLDSRNDAFVSVITLVSAAIYLLTGRSVDAIAGLLISALILKAGIGVLLETISELLGRAGEKDLAAALYREIRETPGILNAADMMLHNYGPDRWSGSVNIEVDHHHTIGELYETIHALQLRLMHDYKITMVFGMYAVDADHVKLKQFRKDIGAFIRSHEHIKNFHALYLDEKTNTLYVDFVVDYALRDWDVLRAEFERYWSTLYPELKPELTIETEYV